MEGGEMMRYLIEFKIREPVAENLKRTLEINDEREKAGKGFVARGILKNRWYGITEGTKIIQIVETDDPSLISEWVEAYWRVVKHKITLIMTPEEYMGE
jgi:hypothetical protein